MASPADDDELEAAPLEFRHGLVFIALALVGLAIAIVTRPPRWLLAEPDDHTVNGNGPAVDADTLARAES
jgi:hypothetical protein